MRKRKRMIEFAHLATSSMNPDRLESLRYSNRCFFGRNPGSYPSSYFILLSVFGGAELPGSIPELAVPIEDDAAPMPPTLPRLIEVAR